MSDLTVYLAREHMPNPSGWASAIVDAGFSAELDANFDGAESGFEYASGPIEYVDDLELPNDFDFSVTFATQSDERELAASVVAAAVLCSLSKGILVDPQADITVESNDAIEWAREQLDELSLE
jgi:hypothetical protein